MLQGIGKQAESLIAIAQGVAPCYFLKISALKNTA
jgi:hypothetical protein